MNQEIFFKKVSDALSQQLPFVIYRKAASKTTKNFKLTGIFQNNDRLYYAKNFTEKGFVMAPFDFSKPSPLIPLDQSERIKTSVMKDLDSSKKLAPRLKTNSDEKSFHLALVAKAVEKIKKRMFRKAVLSRRFEAKTDKNPLEIFKNLLQSYPTAFTYCWFHPKVGLWMGATPETLLKIAGKNLKTMALAGTKAVDEAPKPQWTDKEREEQQLVTDFISETLKGKVSNLNVGHIDSIKAGRLWHLKCDISARLDRKENLNDILKALHPTPAVGGLPKQSSIDFILNNENYDRAFYTGFIGELNFDQKNIRSANRRNVENQAYAKTEEQTELFVNLRCMQLVGKTCQIYVGGGIVKDSNPEDEWQETVNKSQTMLDVI